MLRQVDELLAIQKEYEGAKAKFRIMEENLSQKKSELAEVKASKAVTNAKMAELQSTPQGALQTLSYNAVNSVLPDLQIVSCKKCIVNCKKQNVSEKL